MSQKERKKQLLNPEDTSPPPNGLATSVKNDKPKWTGWGDPTACHSQTNGKVSLASIMKSEESTKGKFREWWVKNWTELKENAYVWKTYLFNNNPLQIFVGENKFNHAGGHWFNNYV